MVQALTGSMTSAGITALTICEVMLRNSKQAKKLRKERARMRDAVHAGYAWMLNNFSVRKNKHGHAFHFYYLYGLERACELGQIATVGKLGGCGEPVCRLQQLGALEKGKRSLGAGAEVNPYPGKRL